MTPRLPAVLALLAVAVTGCRHDGGDDPKRALRGAPAADACRPVTDHPTEGASTHRNGAIEYDRTPPNSGPHDPQWAQVRQRVYTPDDAPTVEQVVHNLEHGYVVVWYDPVAADAGALNDVLGAMAERKLFAVPWMRGTLPTPYVLTAWGHEQQCTAPSGEALSSFVAEHGGENGDAPEPRGP